MSTSLFGRITSVLLGLSLCLHANMAEFANWGQLRMTNDLNFIAEIFDSHYAPKQWKEQYAQYDLQAEVQEVYHKIYSLPLTTKEFQKELKNFTLKLKDYHVGIWFYSTEEARLPFNVKSAQQRYFVSYINEDAPEDFPFHIGDEILTFDERPIDDAVQQIKKELLGDNSPATDQALAEIKLTYRAGFIGAEVPQGAITITGIDAKTGDNLTSTLEWEHNPEKIGNAPMQPQAHMNLFVAAGTGRKKFSPPLLSFPLLEKEMTSYLTPLFEDLVTKEADNPHLLGARCSMLPPLGNVIWQTDEEDRFEAYIFESPSKHLLGFVRIPSYYMDDEDAAAADFGIMMDWFQCCTDGLIIDQQNNNGGFILYGYALLSTLTDKPLLLPRHRMILDQAEVDYALHLMEDLEEITSNWQARKMLGNTLMGYPMSLKFAESILGYCQFKVSEWNSGKRLSDPYYVFTDTVDPHPKYRYTKPILLLTNAMDFSCADFFPTIMQDNKRATIMGTRTAGAGGYIDIAHFPNFSGIEGMMFTASIAERLNKQPIENLGVTPDINYDLTVNDLQNGYEDYAHFIVNTLEDLLNKQK